MKVGIVGNGVVGSAVSLQLDLTNIPNIAFDPRDGWIDCDVYVVAVPTPLGLDGSLFVDYIDNVLEQIGDKKPVLIKSTLPLEKVMELSNATNNVCYSPEFLTEKNSVNDAKSETKFIVGGSEENAQLWIELFKPLIVDTNNGKVYRCTLLEAGLIKLAENSFLATKVTFANEISELASSMGIEYNNVVAGLVLDERLGSTHWNVPGWDGVKGFGGKCLPKDISALYTFGENSGVSMNLLETVIFKNNATRKRNQT